MDIDIDYVAKLARIDLSRQQKKKFAKQLKDILVYIEKLKELDIGSAEPMSHILPLRNVFREDKAGPSLPQKKVLNNAPAVGGDNFFKVPKIIDGIGK